jgi:hypothetical protein
MSKNYHAEIRITGFETENIERIKATIGSVAEFDENEKVWDADKLGVLAITYFNSDCFLKTGTGEDDFTERLAKLVWQANGKYCHIKITMTFLDENPDNEYLFEELEYSKLMETEPQGGVIDYVES